MILERVRLSRGRIICSIGDTQTEKRDKVLRVERRKRVGRGAKSHDRKKAWSAISHSIPVRILLGNFANNLYV
jgi:hypothetical protein